MSQNAPATRTQVGLPTELEELRRYISHAREQAESYLSGNNASHWEELTLGAAATMLARAEGVLEQTWPQPSSSTTAGLSSAPCASTYTLNIGSSSISTSSTTRVMPPLSSSTIPVSSTPISIATQVGLPGVASLNSYSEPTIPSDRLTFSYLWKLWALQNRKTQQDIPILGGKFLDLYSLALNIDSLGGQAEMHRVASLWKRLAVQLKLIDSEAQDDEYSKRVVDMLQKTQEELLLPFEQYCITWSRLSEEERNKSLVEYATAAKSTKANLPPLMPEVGEMLLPTSVPDYGTITLTPNSLELQEASKLVDTYFYGFYPGIRLHTKIERLLKLPSSEFPKHTWTRKRLDWLSKFSQNHASRSADQVIACMTMVIQQQLQEKKLTPMPPSGWPANDVKVTEILPPTGSAMFSPSLIVQANQFVESTLQAIEDVRACMKRVELPDAHRQPLKALVTDAYDLALFFYRAVALHYMLFINEKDTRSTMMHAMLILEQFFLSSTGYPAYIISFEYAVASVTRIRDVVNSMRDTYAKRCRDHLNLKLEESRNIA